MTRSAETRGRQHTLSCSVQALCGTARGRGDLASDPQKHSPPLSLAPHPLRLQALFSEPQSPHCGSGAPPCSPSLLSTSHPSLLLTTVANIYADLFSSTEVQSSGRAPGSRAGPESQGRRDTPLPQGQTSNSLVNEWTLSETILS